MTIGKEKSEKRIFKIKKINKMPKKAKKTLSRIKNLKVARDIKRALPRKSKMGNPKAQFEPRKAVLSSQTRQKIKELTEYARGEGD